MLHRASAKWMTRVTAALALLTPANSLAVGTGPASSRALSSMRRMGGPLASVCEAVPAVVTAEPATHPAFELLKVEMIDEYTIKCATYRHKKSGAELISAQADDDNKVFGIVFRTPVTDSTGVPHILEHSVLCGSDKYTSKEPFVELLKGSLQTFLNAFTYPDRTCYPVASQNTKDFYNLVNVYLDAVLHPRAKRDPTVLAQEGWHYELEKKEDPLTCGCFSRTLPTLASHTRTHAHAHVHEAVSRTQRAAKVVANAASGLPCDDRQLECRLAKNSMCRRHCGHARAAASKTTHPSATL